MSRRLVPFIISAGLHIGLICWAHHVDIHPNRFGGLKYTDIDWNVVSDGAAHIFRIIPGKYASGWLTRLLSLPIGDPYERATFRYSPLLPLVLSPTLLHPLIGKLTLSVLSLLVPCFLLSGPNATGYWSTHLLWTLNPFVLNITTRGSPEAIVILLVVAMMYYLRKADEAGTVHREWYESAAAVVWAVAVAWKIYPVIYGFAIWAWLAGKYGAFGKPIWRFAFIAATTFFVLNGVLWSIWGQPFLEHTFLYHLKRQDHRHNFSPYFYPIYLSLFQREKVTSTGILSAINTASNHPLSSFIPQFGLVAIAGGLLPSYTGLEFAMFVQTAIFVIFNKVCTSQYFVWFLPLLAPIIPRLNLKPIQAVSLVLLWISGQAAWLYTAYRLELLGEAVHLPLWACGLGLMVISTYIVGRLLDAYVPRHQVSVVSPRRTGHGGVVKGF